MKCGSLKSRIGDSKFLTRGLSRGSVSHKGTPISTLLKHSLRVSLLGNQVSSADSTTITLIPGSTKELLHKGWGSPRPPTQRCRRRSTPSRRVDDVPTSIQSSKVPAHQNLLLVHSRTTAQRLQAFQSHSLRVNPLHNTFKVF